MKKSPKPSDSNLTQKPSISSPSTPPSSQPDHLVDLARCNHQRLWRSVTRNLKRYLTCFKQTEPARPEDDRKLQKNCNYYSEMNNEERDEKLKSAIVYCKDSTCLDDPHQGQRTLNFNLDGTVLNELRRKPHIES